MIVVSAMGWVVVSVSSVSDLCVCVCVWCICVCVWCMYVCMLCGVCNLP